MANTPSTSNTLQDQVAAAVAQLVPQGVNYSYDPSGVRSIGAPFQGFQSAAIGTFLIEDGAPFYVLYLASQRLTDLIDVVVGEIQSLITAAGVCAKNAQPVTNLAPLTNAAAALNQLASAMATRTGVYQDITTVPTFKRYQQSVGQFLSTEGKKATSQGALVGTSKQAQSTLKANAMQMRADWQTVIERATLWANAIAAYTALNLPSVLSATIMGNASAQLQAQVDQLTGLSPIDRLEVLQDAVVSLSAGVATVQGFGSLSPPTTFVLLSGTGGVYTDATHPATPAILPSAFYEGYSIYPGHDTLQLQVDGAYNITLNPPGSYIARIDCPSRGPYVVAPSMSSFDVGIGTNTGPTTSTATTSIVIPSGTIDPWTVATTINNETSTVVAHVYHATPKTTQEVSLVSTSPGTATFTLLAPTTWDTFGVITGDTLLITDTASSAVDTVWTATSVVGAVLSASTGFGLTPPAAPSVLVSVGIDASIRFYIQLADPVAALANRQSLQLTDSVGSAGTLAQLFFFSGMQALSARTSADKFAQYVNQGAATLVAGAARLSASTEFVATFHTGEGRTNTTDYTLLTFYDAADEATVVSTGVGTTTLQSVSVAALGVGAVVVVRASNDTSDINTYSTITAVSGSQFTIGIVLAGTGSVAVEAATKSAFSFTDIRGEYTIVIAEGQLFDGTYTTSSLPPPTPLDVYLTSSLNGAVGLGGQPVTITSMQIGQNLVALSSEDTTLASSVSVLGTGSFDAAFVPGPYPNKAIATTVWLQLPSIPNTLDTGDIFEVYVTSRTVPDAAEVIADIDTTNNLLQLQQPIRGDLTALALAVTNNLPFAKVRRVVKQNYDTVAGQIQDWLASSLIADTLSTFRALDAALNPLLANLTPSIAQATTAQAQLTTMLNALNTLSGYLAAYSAPVVSDVDSLVKGYLQKGLDKAVDTLLAADFATFFALDNQDASYCGSLQKNISAVQTTDFPVRKDNRVDSAYAASEQTTAQYDDVDFEYTPDQLDTTQPDINEPSSPTFTTP